jgi:hypothetical protein
MPRECSKSRCVCIRGAGVTFRIPTTGGGRGDDARTTNAPRRSRPARGRAPNGRLADLPLAVDVAVGGDLQHAVAAAVVDDGPVVLAAVAVDGEDLLDVAAVPLAVERVADGPGDVVVRHPPLVGVAVPAGLARADGDVVHLVGRQQLAAGVDPDGQVVAAGVDDAPVELAVVAADEADLLHLVPAALAVERLAHLLGQVVVLDPLLVGAGADGDVRHVGGAEHPAALGDEDRAVGTALVDQGAEVGLAVAAHLEDLLDLVPPALAVDRLAGAAGEVVVLDPDVGPPAVVVRQRGGGAGEEGQGRSNTGGAGGHGLPCRR